MSQLKEELKIFKTSGDKFQEINQSKKSALFLEQTDEMCTVRFSKDGTPILEADGQLSRVPAGHGTLTRLFPKIAEAFPDAQALFIKNIDNVLPKTDATEKAHQHFFSAYNIGFETVKMARRAAKNRDSSALESAIKFFELHWSSVKFGAPVVSTAIEKELASISNSALDFLQKIFHLTPQTLDISTEAKSSSWELMEYLWERPFNMLGQVPNSGKDIGGTPVFVETDHGIQKICMELPHFSSRDKQDFLMNASKATHFNPVFAAAELVVNNSAYEHENNPFWIVAAKSYKGQDVFYHETVLYELIGNSLFTNCMFVEVPRIVFNPHKSLADGTATLN